MVIQRTNPDISAQGQKFIYKLWLLETFGAFLSNNDDVVPNLKVVLDYLLFITVDLSLRTCVEHSNPLWRTSIVVAR